MSGDEKVSQVGMGFALHNLMTALPHVIVAGIASVERAVVTFDEKTCKCVPALSLVSLQSAEVSQHCCYLQAYLISMPESLLRCCSARMGPAFDCKGINNDYFSGYSGCSMRRAGPFWCTLKYIIAVDAPHML